MRITIKEVITNRAGESDETQQAEESQPPFNSLEVDDSKRAKDKDVIQQCGDVRFILHPHLDVNSPSSLCSVESSSTGSLIHRGSSEIERMLQRNLPKPSRFVTKSPFRSREKTKDEALSEYLVTETAQQILNGIVSGKWKYKNMVLDEENVGGTTKMSGVRPCSNAHCVREMENQRRRKLKQVGDLPPVDNQMPLFEDGNLPSYHSLLDLWKENCRWSETAFQNGFPENDADFLRVWRECRKNPEAFGIKLSPPQELTPPTIPQEEDTDGQKPPKTGLQAKGRKPVRLASREYYNLDWKPVISRGERHKQRCRYEELQRMYPHLPQLCETDYRNNPSTVKIRLKQAEDWHRLVSITNKPQPCVKRDANKDTAVPRYATRTTSSHNKISEKFA